MNKTYVAILAASLSFCFLSTGALASDKINVLLIGDSESCDLGLGNSLVLNFKNFFGNQPIDLKVDAYSNATPADFTSPSRAARWGNYMRYGSLESATGVEPSASEGNLVGNHQAFPNVSRLMSFRGGSKKADVVFIELGTNLLGASDTTIKKQAVTLLHQILTMNSRARIVWITPANDRKRMKKTDPDTTDQALADALTSVQQDMSNQGFQNSVLVPLFTRKIFGMRPQDGSSAWPDRDEEHFKRAPKAWLNFVAQAIIKIIH